MTLGVIRRVRSTITGQDPAFGYSGKWYERGKLVGEVHSLALGFVSPCGLGAVAKLSHRAINAVQAVGGLANARDNVRAGNYGAAALDLVGVSGNLASFLRACFSGDMLVLTRERGAVRWDDLHVGEEVWSQDEFDPNAPATWKRVEEIFQTEAFICTLRVAGQEIKTTGEHPFWVQGKGWTAVNQLQPGDKLRGDDGQLYPVESVTATDEWLPVYNARIADYHTYYVQAPGAGVLIWAHNACRELHHIATNKSIKSGWTAKFQRLFAKAGMTLEHKANKFLMVGHKGRHSKTYHHYVYERLTQATDGLTGRSYKAALLWELRALKRDLIKFPEMLKGHNLPPIG